MRLVNVFITSGYICINSPDSSSIIAFQELHGQQNYLEALSDLLTDPAIENGISVNFIIDQRSVYYFYQRFPLTNRRKIDNMLHYELEDSLIDELDTYHLDYYLRKSKEISTTELSIYAIQKATLSGLQNLCKEHFLELKWVLSFNNLLDLKFRGEGEPQNHIYISIDSSVARIFVYKDGFLTNNVSLSFDENQNNQDPAGVHEQILNKINQKLVSIQLSDDITYQIVVGNPFLAEFKPVEGDRLRMEDIEATHGNFDPSNLKDLVGPAILNHPFKINLSNPNRLLFQELKKRTKGLVFAAVILVICSLLYGTSVGYAIYQNSNRLKQLEIQYHKSVQQLLPKGASRSNALSILKDRLQKLKQDRNKNRRFSKREYFISKTLTELSSLKSVVSSLHLNRFSYNKQVIRFQGTVKSISDVEDLKDQLELIFPEKSHNIKLNQRSIGNESVELSISIHYEPR